MIEIATVVAAQEKRNTEIESGTTKATGMRIHAANEGIELSAASASTVCWVRSLHFQHFFPTVRVKSDTHFIRKWHG